MLEELFNETDVRALMNVPISDSVNEDEIIWHYSKDDEYSVKSGYKVCMEVVYANLDIKIPKPWSLIWNLNIPLKVKYFAWKLFRNILPVREVLQRRGVPNEL